MLPYPDRIFARKLCGLLLGVVALGIVASWLIGFERAGGENGIIELAELFVLLPAGLCFGWAAGRGGGAFRIFTLSAAYLCLFFFLREFKADGTNNMFFLYLDSHLARIHLSLIFAVLLAASLWRHHRAVPDLIRYALRGGIWPLLLCAAFFGIASLAEHAYTPGSLWQWAEEMLELCGETVLLVTSVWFLRQSAKPV